MKALLLLLLSVLAAPIYGADYSLQLTPDNTKVEWTLTDVLHTVRGTFQVKRGSLRLDPGSGKAGGEVVVDVASGASGSGARDNRMHKNILESALFPEAVFVPDRVEGKLAPSGASRVKVHGLMGIHGGHHEVIMDVCANVAQGRMTAEISFDVPYVDWGLKDPSTLFLKVDKKVHVTMHVNAMLQGVS